MFKRCTGFSIPDILIEKQIRQGSDDKNVGSKRPKNFRHTPDKFCQLKTGKRSGDPNEGVESRWLKSSLPRETRNQEWADLIRTVEIKNAPLIEQDSRIPGVALPRVR